MQTNTRPSVAIATEPMPTEPSVTAVGIKNDLPYPYA